MIKFNNKSEHFVRIAWFQICLLIIGILAWLNYNRYSAMVFAIFGIISIIFWYLHIWIITKTLTVQSVKLRFLFGMLIILKLALLMLTLRVIIKYFQQEILSSVTGITLFAASIIIEAIYLAIVS